MTGPARASRDGHPIFLLEKPGGTQGRRRASAHGAQARLEALQPRCGGARARQGSHPASPPGSSWPQCAPPSPPPQGARGHCRWQPTPPPPSTPLPPGSRSAPPLLTPARGPRERCSRGGRGARGRRRPGSGYPPATTPRGAAEAEGLGPAPRGAQSGYPTPRKQARWKGRGRSLGRARSPGERITVQVPVKRGRWRGREGLGSAALKRGIASPSRGCGGAAGRDSPSPGSGARVGSGARSRSERGRCSR